ncbi:hypothetical protein BKA70DRAFT_1229510 [Coprinopsis sp. MPI-PUGE-AT-0042]|nr:hypothetical protein BKA70DRAFT_1229510 [Coprinopsis sp. MPI-PUGE-AT-0042]
MAYSKGSDWEEETGVFNSGYELIIRELAVVRAKEQGQQITSPGIDVTCSATDQGPMAAKKIGVRPGFWAFSSHKNRTWGPFGTRFVRTRIGHHSDLQTFDIEYGTTALLRTGSSFEESQNLGAKAVARGSGPQKGGLCTIAVQCLVHMHACFSLLPTFSSWTRKPPVQIAPVGIMRTRCWRQTRLVAPEIRAPQPKRNFHLEVGTVLLFQEKSVLEGSASRSGHGHAQKSKNSISSFDDLPARVFFLDDTLVNPALDLTFHDHYAIVLTDGTTRFREDRRGKTADPSTHPLLQLSPPVPSLSTSGVHVATEVAGDDAVTISLDVGKDCRIKARAWLSNASPTQPPAPYSPPAVTITRLVKNFDPPAMPLANVEEANTSTRMASEPSTMRLVDHQVRPDKQLSFWNDEDKLGVVTTAAPKALAMFHTIETLLKEIFGYVGRESHGARWDIVVLMKEFLTRFSLLALCKTLQFMRNSDCAKLRWVSMVLKSCNQPNDYVNGSDPYSMLGRDVGIRPVWYALPVLYNYT